MRVLIVEDEARIAKYLARVTQDLMGDRCTALSTVPTVSAARTSLAERGVDLLLLDLNLQGTDGFEILKGLSTGRFQTIVVSAYRDKAVEAFRYGVLDFVPKPFTRERFALALSRVTDPAARAKEPAKFLAVRVRGTIRVVDLEEVVRFKGARGYSEAHLRDGSVLLHDKPLNQLCKLLPHHFVRIHRSWVVDIRDMETIKVFEGSRYQAVMANGDCLPVGRSRLKALKERLI